MEYHWLLPQPGAVKFNVHGATPFITFFSGNNFGLEMVIRNSEGELLKLSTGALPASSDLKDKLNVIHHDLIKTFDDNYKEMIVETDNLDTFMLIKNFPVGVPQELAEVSRQIFFWINGPRWKCILALYFPRL